ncbi:MAG: S8 family serine peptidase, partial [Gammaproteobacteria bacterium]
AESTLQAVSAPGHDILTTMPHGAYDFISGCSFSAAHVTGLVALRLALEPAATAADIHAGLRNGHQQVARLLALIAHRN